ncbi:alpha/beta hydrolase [Roseibium algae]|uniref:Alpha/beta hydrolase n=1 Tax=Roseibium algae TaxID=3123038 RepID=A0ABU8TIW6_9HYPH
MQARSERTIAPSRTTCGKVLVQTAVLVMCLALAACANRPGVGSLSVSTASAPGATTHDILVVTTRERDTQPGTLFNGERKDGINYAKATISVPPSPPHIPGQVQWGSIIPGDPNTDFVARSASYIPDRAAMLKDLNKRLMKLPKGERTVFLFIHGYNTKFVEGLFRFTQIIHDSKTTNVPVYFSWASRGQLTDYVYDLNSAMVARTALASTVKDLVDSKAEKIVILAHSMGTYLLMETARQLTPAAAKKFQSKVQQVILAAPDIDIDVFKEQLRHMGKPKNPFVIMVSKDDRALKASRKIAGDKERVGAYSNDLELAELGAIVVDLTEVESADGAHHSKFAQLAQFGPELSRTLTQSSLTQNVPNQGSRLSNAGQDLGSVVSSTAQAAVSLPIAIITAPISLATGGR